MWGLCGVFVRSVWELCGVGASHVPSGTVGDSVSRDLKSRVASAARSLVVVVGGGGGKGAGSARGGDGAEVEVAVAAGGGGGGGGGGAERAFSKSCNLRFAAATSAWLASSFVLSSCLLRLRISKASFRSLSFFSSQNLTCA